MIQIQVFHDKVQVMNKLLNLDINDNKTPTFAESGYEFDPDEYCRFLNCVKHQTDSFFAFASNEDIETALFDGIYFHMGEDNPILIFTTAIGKANMSIHIPMKDCYQHILGDLDALYKVINDLVCSRLDYLEYLEHSGEEVEEDKKNETSLSSIREGSDEKDNNNDSK